MNFSLLRWFISCEFNFPTDKEAPYQSIYEYGSGHRHKLCGIKQGREYVIIGVDPKQRTEENKKSSYQLHIEPNVLGASERKNLQY